MERRDQYGVTIRRRIFLMNGAGRRYQETSASGKKWRKIDASVLLSEELFGALFEVNNFLVKEESIWERGPVKCLLEVHKSLPRDIDVEILERNEGLFEDIPIRRESLIAVDGWVPRSIVHDPNHPRVAVEDGERWKSNRLSKG